MKTVLMLMVVGLAAVVLADEKYTDKYDDFDVDSVLENKRLMGNYFECVMGRKSCTREGKVLKEYLPEALQTKCAKCTDKQRQTSEKVIKVMIDKYPAYWKELNQKFDPTGKYKAQYEEEARALDIKLP